LLWPAWGSASGPFGRSTGPLRSFNNISGPLSKEVIIYGRLGNYIYLTRGPFQSFLCVSRARFKSNMFIQCLKTGVLGPYVAPSWSTGFRLQKRVLDYINNSVQIFFRIFLTMMHMAGWHMVRAMKHIVGFVASHLVMCIYKIVKIHLLLLPLYLLCLIELHLRLKTFGIWQNGRLFENNPQFRLSLKSWSNLWFEHNVSSQNSKFSWVLEPIVLIITIDFFLKVFRLSSVVIT